MEIPNAFQTTLVGVAALFPIVNPLGNAAIFLSLTRGASAETRRLLARRIAFNGFSLLVVSMLVGTYILAFFGISLPVVQVGGGLVLTATGWSLLTHDATSTGETVAPTHRDLLQQSFYPLTLPLTVGPGSLSVAITLGASASRRNAQELALVVGSVLAAAIIGLAIYLAYRWAERLERFLGESAMSVFVRLSSFILLCLGVQILWGGVSALWLTLPRR